MAYVEMNEAAAVAELGMDEEFEKRTSAVLGARYVIIAKDGTMEAQVPRPTPAGYVIERYRLVVMCGESARSAQTIRSYAPLYLGWKKVEASE